MLIFAAIVAVHTRPMQNGRKPKPGAPCRVETGIEFPVYWEDKLYR